MEHTSTTPFTTTGFLLLQTEYSDTLEQKVDRAENELSTSGNNLSRGKQASLSTLCRQKANQIRESIRNMRSMGFASDVVSRTVDQSIREMGCEISQFRYSITTFDRDKQSVTNGLIDTSQKISDLNLSFQPILLPKRDYSVDVGCQDAIKAHMDGKALERLVEAKKVQNKKIALARALQDDAPLGLVLGSTTQGLSEEQKKELLMEVVPNAQVTAVSSVSKAVINIGANVAGLARISGNSQTESDELVDDVKEGAAGKMGHMIKHQYGQGASYWFEIASNMVLGHVPKESKNPYRDLFIAADSHIVIMETLSHFLPGRVPAYVAITGSHVVAKGAKSLEPHVERLAANMDPVHRGHVELGDGLSYSESIALCQLSLKLAQVPSQVIHDVHHRMSIAVSRAADSIGLTEENVKTALKIFAKYSPELMEEKIWVNAYEDIQKLRNKESN